MATKVDDDVRTDRRAVLKGGALLGLLYNIGGAAVMLSPREAYARRLQFTELSPPERRALEAVGEILLPGSVKAGLAHFVDHQISAAHGDCLLMARVLDVPAPISLFYRAALAAIDQATMHVFSVVFADASLSHAHVIGATTRDGYPICAMSDFAPGGRQRSVRESIENTQGSSLCHAESFGLSRHLRQ